MLHFQIWEFASPDEEYSGLKMNPDFLSMIDDARDLAKIPLVLTPVTGQKFIIKELKAVRQVPT